MLWLSLLAKVRALRARGYRANPFVNGAMRVAQRTTSAALTTTAAIAALDAWWAVQNGAADGFIQQQSGVGGLPGFLHRMRVGRNGGSAVVGTILAATVGETLDCVRFQGKVCNLNFIGIKGAQFSSAAAALNVQLIYSTGTDQTGLQLLTGAWAGVGAAINQNIALTLGYVRYSIPVLVPTTATQLGVIFSYVPTGVAGADDSFYITGLQLNEGADAAPFDTTFYGDDFNRCLRRLPVFDAAMSTGDRWNGPALSTTAAVFWIPFPEVARVAVTGMVVPDITKWSVFCGRNGQIGPGTSSFFNGNGRYTGGIQVAFVAGAPTVVAGDIASLLPNATSAKMIFTGAEI